MKIKYKFANGEISYVEVSEEVGQALLESRRKEASLDKKEYRHSACSIDVIEFEGDEFADKDTPESLLLNKEGDGRIKAFYEILTERQRRCLELRLDGLTIAEIAKVEGLQFMSVKDCLTCIQKKFQTFFQNIP